MNEESSGRFDAELDLLRSMYPSEVTFHPHSREIVYTTQGRSTCTLRIPDAYLETELPEVVVASAAGADVRDSVQKFVHEECQSGEEIIDSVLLHFNGLLGTEAGKVSNDTTLRAAKDCGKTCLPNHKSTSKNEKATVVVWLHHLLNTNKRKQALSPSSPAVAGLTRPGYPGVLVYTGPADAVHEHLSELKHLKWQAFQVRLQSPCEWHFQHGLGVVEVEAIKDVVADIIGKDIQDEFLECMKIK